MFDVVCLTASLGGIRGYAQLLAGIPAHFPAALVLVQHRLVGPADRLPALLRPSSRLPVIPLASGHPVRPGVVHVAPAGQSATFDRDGRITLSPTRGHRLSDALFASAAARYGTRLIVGVLSGRLDDGAAGVRRVKGAGGRVLAQDEATSQAYGMPSAAIATGCVDFVLPLPVLADAITALVMAPGAANMMRVALPSWAQTLPRSG
jgi:two-component system, chemotaxis family, protein-glutamate methylesterase/glutaminase